MSIAGNQKLLQLYEELHWQIQLVLVLSNSKHQRAQQTAAEHGAVMEAIIAKDVVRAQQALTVHLVNAEADLIRRLPEESLGLAEANQA